MMQVPLQCPVCGVEAFLKCGGCKNVVYCGRDHQKQHWRKQHKAMCKCYEIARDPILGRYIRATRDIKKGEVILRESPSMIGPKLYSYPMCLGCHQQLHISPGQRNYYKCSKCTWPLCGPNCENSKYHKDECELMSKRKFLCHINYDRKTGPKMESAYCVIAPLRCLLLQNSNPNLFEKISDLEDHLDMRINSPVYNILKSNLVTFVRKILALDELTEHEILRMAAILDTNTFEIRIPSKDLKVRALFLDMAMMSHDCVPNTRHVFENNLQMVVMATVDIPKGAVISDYYTQSLKSTLLRREHLMQSKCFACMCNRCSDPTELDTFAGAIMCSQCKIGKIISLDPLNQLSDWKCQLCSHKIKVEKVILGNHSLQKEIESLDKTTPKPYEDFLRQYRDTLYDRNTHVLQVKYALIQLYGNVEGYRFHELTDEEVERKTELCHELLDVADILEPGFSRFRGLLLLDLQEIMAVKIKRDFQKGLLTRDSTKEKLMESMKILNEAVEILKVEPDMDEILQERVCKLTKEIEID